MRVGFDVDRANAIMKQMNELQAELKRTLAGGGSGEDELTRSPILGEKGKEEACDGLMRENDEELERLFSEALSSSADEQSKRHKPIDKTKIISPATATHLQLWQTERAEAKRHEIALDKLRREDAMARARREREADRLSIEAFKAHARPHEYTLPRPAAAPKKKKPFPFYGKWNNNNNYGGGGGNGYNKKPVKRASKRGRDPYIGGDWIQDSSSSRSDRAGGSDRK
jgi:hypothetical protein